LFASANIVKVKLLRTTGWVGQVTRMRYDNQNLVEKPQETLPLGRWRGGGRI